AVGERSDVPVGAARLRRPGRPFELVAADDLEAHAASLAPGGREVLVVLGAAPRAAPAPPLGAERADGLVARVDHPLEAERAVRVAAALLRGDVASGDVRVLDRIDVDRAAVRVLGPARRAGHETAVER